MEAAQNAKAFPGVEPGPEDSEYIWHYLLRQRANQRLGPSKIPVEQGCLRSFPMNSYGYCVIAMRWLLKAPGPSSHRCVSVRFNGPALLE